MNLRFLIALVAGYILGARAGRQRYDEITRIAREFLDSDLVRQLRAELPGGAGAGSSTAMSGAVTPPVIVGPGPRGRSTAPEATVDLPDVEPSTASGAAPAADVGPAKRLDPPTA